MNLAVSTSSARLAPKAVNKDAMLFAGRSRILGLKFNKHINLTRPLPAEGAGVRPLLSSIMRSHSFRSVDRRITDRLNFYIEPVCLHYIFGIFNNL